MSKSLSQQKKELRGHISALKQSAVRLQLATPVFKLYSDKLDKVKNQANMNEWYYAFSKRINAMIGQDHGEAGFMRSQLDSMARIVGVRR